MKSVPQDMFSSRIIAWTLSTLICSLPLCPQSTYTGKLSGEVTDPSGAVIAGAKVTLTDQATSVQTSVTTDSKGVYVLTGLRPTQVGMLSFRAFAQGKPTWLLNYSWDSDKNVAPSDAMKNLAMSQIMAGVNVWDAPGHSMAGSNDIRTRTLIYKWIAQHEKTFYSPRSPLSPVGVYFSPKSRNYDSVGFLPSYRGTLLLLLQKHREVQVVTPRTISGFRGPVLVLPDVSILNGEERSSLREFLSKGGHLVITGTDATEFGDATGITRFKGCPAKSYFEHAQKDFAAASQIVPAEFLASVDTKPQMAVEAPPTVVTNIAVVNGNPTIFFANFTGLVPHMIAVPTPQNRVRISMPATDRRTLRVLPFLGEPQTVHGQRIGDLLVFNLPSLERGAVAWFEDAKSIH